VSSLSLVEKRQFERLLGMGTGYVLDFSDRTFGEFCADVAGIDIHAERYTQYGSSKAKKLRAFWELEDDPTVGKLLQAFVQHLEDNAHTKSDFDSVKRCKAIASRLLSGTPSLVSLKKAAESLNAATLSKQIRRMEESIHSDPELAIGTAKELVETVCRTVLTERGRDVEGKPELPALTMAALKELELLPDGLPEATRGVETVRRLVSNLSALTQGIAELRNLYGTGHGKDGKAASIEPRHAALAVGSAATFARFLFETHQGSR
jgi:hypothetical protein